MRFNTKAFRVHVERSDGTVALIVLAYELLPDGPHVVTEVFRLVWTLPDEANACSSLARELTTTNHATTISAGSRSDDADRVERIMREIYGSEAKVVVQAITT